MKINMIDNNRTFTKVPSTPFIIKHKKDDEKLYMVIKQIDPNNNRNKYYFVNINTGIANLDIIYYSDDILYQLNNNFEVFDGRLNIQM